MDSERKNIAWGRPPCSIGALSKTLFKSLSVVVIVTDGTVGNPESYLVHKRSPKCPGLVPIDYESSFPYILGKKNYLGPDEKLYTVGAQVLEEGGGVSDQDPDQRLLRDGIDRRVELCVIHKGEAVPENIGEYCK